MQKEIDVLNGTIAELREENKRARTAQADELTKMRQMRTRHLASPMSDLEGEGRHAAEPNQRRVVRSS